jgi:large subunit ribosomal protein L19
MNLIDAIEAKQKKSAVADFSVGDTVKLNVKVIEGNKERQQPFQGVVMQIANSGIRQTFTVRKVTAGVGVERIFPVHSPNISDVVVLRRGSVRRARLYFLRERSGKAARIRERRADTAAD